jgi:hypothetical protein
MEQAMAQRADSRDTTIASDLSSSADKVVRLFHTPAGPLTERPQAEPPAIDRRTLMVRAHAIARQARPHMPSYRAALSFGLQAAWGMIATRREFAAVRARVAPRILTADQRAASERATRRCGASYMPF